MRERLSAPRPPEHQALHEQAIAHARGVLGEAQFTAAWETGQALPLERAAAEALE